MTPDTPPPEDQRRKKLVGRAMVIGLLILVMIYLAPLLISRLG
jgi:hypothetical protein